MATFRLDLDLDKSPRIGARVRVRQGDVESCVVEASVFDAGAQADLSGRSARFCCLKPDRTMVRDTSCEVSGSVITHTLDQQVSAVSGLIQLAYFEVLDGTGAVVDSTQAFSIEVEEGAEAGSSGVSQSYYSELDALISQYEQAIQQSQSDYEAAEASRQSAFDSAQQQRATDFSSAQSSRDAAFQQAQTQRQTDYEQAEAARDAAQDANDAKQAENDGAQAANDAKQAKNNADQAANNQAAQGLVAVILTSGEYDTDTLEPTVSGEVGKMYLVPMPQAQAVAAALPVAFTLEETGDGTYAATRAASAEDGDTYVEWLWINATWERIGLSTATIDPITTDQIDAVCSDGAPQGKQVLNLTGLSYLWAKLKSWATSAFAAVSHKHAAADVTSGTLAADRLPVVPVAKGGTGATSASAALTALGAASASELDDVRDSLYRITFLKTINSNSTVGFEWVRDGVLYLYVVIDGQRAMRFTADFPS